MTRFAAQDDIVRHFPRGQGRPHARGQARDVHYKGSPPSDTPREGTRPVTRLHSAAPGTHRRENEMADQRIAGSRPSRGMSRYEKRQAAIERMRAEARAEASEELRLILTEKVPELIRRAKEAERQVRSGDVGWVGNLKHYRSILDKILLPNEAQKIEWDPERA